MYQRKSSKKVCFARHRTKTTRKTTTEPVEARSMPLNIYQNKKKRIPSVSKYGVAIY